MYVHVHVHVHADLMHKITVHDCDICISIKRVSNIHPSSLSFLASWRDFIY